MSILYMDLTLNLCSIDLMWFDDDIRMFSFFIIKNVFINEFKKMSRFKMYDFERKWHTQQTMTFEPMFLNVECRLFILKQNLKILKYDRVGSGAGGSSQIWINKQK